MILKRQAGSCVELLEELFDDGGGALDDLAGGVLIHDLIEEDSDVAYEAILSRFGVLTGWMNASNSDYRSSVLQSD